MADQEKVMERARAIFKSTNERILKFGPGRQTACWNEAVRIAAEEIALQEAEERAKQKAVPDPANDVPKETSEDEPEPSRPLWVIVAMSFLFGAALGAFAALVASSYPPVTAKDFPAQYRPAFERMTKEIKRAELRFAAARACIDLRGASSKDACEIK